MRWLGILAWLVASAWLGAGKVEAQPDQDGLYEAQVLPAPAPGTMPLRRSHVRVGAALRPSVALVHAIDNQNSRYQLIARYPRRPECPQLALRLGGRWQLNESHGHDAQHCDGAFVLDPAQASAAAALLGVPRQDRSPIGERVVATFSASARAYAPGAAIEIAIRFNNPRGAPAVSWQRGGRNRGPRDNQFSFQIFRDGQPLTPIEAHDFGGLSTFEALPPSGTAEVRTPLAPWGDVSVPGRYEVRCSYQTSFVPLDADPYGPASRGRIWDRRFEGSVRFEVR